MARQSPLMRTYNKLRSVKKKYCEGKATKADVNSASSAYVSAAMKKGQTKAEATKKANRVKSGGCKMTSAIRGKKKTTRKRTTRKKR